MSTYDDGTYLPDPATLGAYCTIAQGAQVTGITFTGLELFQASLDLDIFAPLGRVDAGVFAVIGSDDVDPNTGLLFGGINPVDGSAVAVMNFPLGLNLTQQMRLQQATAFQAKYRQLMPTELFENWQPANMAGPDFKMNGEIPKLAPMARTLLAGAGLLHRWGYNGRSRMLPPDWYRTGMDEFEGN